MKRTAILTLAAVTSVALGSQAAQARVLYGDTAGSAAKASSNAAAVIKAAGTNLHARWSYTNSQSNPRPDNRSGIRSV